MSHRCPTCQKVIHIDPGPLEMPCVECWSITTAAQRAPWIRRLRATTEASPYRAARDPIIVSTTNTQAYVAYLENLLAEREKA